MLFRHAAAAACAVGSTITLLVYLRRRRRLPKRSAPLAFHSCHEHRLRSVEGHKYKILVSLPFDYEREPDKAYPMLIALDGEPYLFPLLTVVARTNHFFAKSYWYPDAIVVGLCADLEQGHALPGGRIDVRALWGNLRPTRARDYLPTDAESPWGAPGAPSLRGISGQADAFVRFLADELLPFLDERYRTYGAAGRALIGKSFGGSGVAHAMIDPRASRCFSQFLLGSPSIAWDDGAFFRLFDERCAAADESEGVPPFGANVLCCYGGEESSAVQPRLKEVLDRRAGLRGSVTLQEVR